MHNSNEKHRPGNALDVRAIVATHRHDEIPEQTLAPNGLPVNEWPGVRSHRCKQPQRRRHRARFFGNDQQTFIHACMCEPTVDAMNSSVSVVIPCYNGAAFSGDAIESTPLGQRDAA